MRRLQSAYTFSLKEKIFKIKPNNKMWEPGENLKCGGTRVGTFVICKDIKSRQEALNLKKKSLFEMRQNVKIILI